MLEFGKIKISRKSSSNGKTFVFLTIATALAAVYGCSGQQGGGKYAIPPTPVEVAPVIIQKVADTFEAVGTIEAIEAITVVSEIDAAVISLPFEEGSVIQQGKLIAQLDDSQLAAEVARAEALELQSHLTYERVKAVVEQKAGAAQDLDDAAAGLKVADANLAMAKARLAKTRIVAPFDGIIGSRKVSVGTFLRAGQEITELANIDNIRVIFSAPENSLAQLTRGAEVTISTTAYSGYSVKGKILAIEPVLDPGTRNGRVVARVPNPGRKFFPGMSANVNVVIQERNGALTIPNEAVFATGNQSFVYKVNPDSTAARAAITLGTRLSDVVEITAGLEPGDQVVRAGHQKLYDGAKVFPITSQAAKLD